MPKATKLYAARKAVGMMFAWAGALSMTLLATQATIGTMFILQKFLIEAAPD